MFFILFFIDAFCLISSDLPFPFIIPSNLFFNLFWYLFVASTSAWMFVYFSVYFEFELISYVQQNLNLFLIIACCCLIVCFNCPRLEFMHISLFGDTIPHSLNSDAMRGVFVSYRDCPASLTSADRVWLLHDSRKSWFLYTCSLGFLIFFGTWRFSFFHSWT